MMLKLLRRGIGIHHGGLLPIIKEVIELLFQDALLKLVFHERKIQSEHQYAGKDVVLNSIERFDGIENHWLSGDEYIQMYGRGVDDMGIAILMANKKLEPYITNHHPQGQIRPDILLFHIGYNILLNIMGIFKN